MASCKLTIEMAMEFRLEDLYHLVLPVLCRLEGRMNQDKAIDVM